MPESCPAVAPWMRDHGSRAADLGRSRVLVMDALSLGKWPVWWQVKGSPGGVEEAIRIQAPVNIGDMEKLCSQGELTVRTIFPHREAS